MKIGEINEKSKKGPRSRFDPQKLTKMMVAVKNTFSINKTTN